MIEPGSSDEESELPARITQPLRDIEADDGTTATLEASISGYPSPKTEWYFRNKELRNDNKYRKEFDEDRCSLVIRDVSKRDEGEYSLVVHNKIGRDTGKAVVTVRGMIFCFHNYNILSPTLIKLVFKLFNKKKLPRIILN